MVDHKVIVLPAAYFKVLDESLQEFQGLSRLLAELDPHIEIVDVSTAKGVGGRVRFIDLFAGAGGMTQGFQDAGYVPAEAVEMVPVACDTHERNFPNCRVHRGPIQEYFPAPSLRGQIDLVVGGPSCQGFSSAGRRDPLDDRNQLFREYVRVVEVIQPSYFVMENVPGILTMSYGEFRRAILQSFSSIGYNTSVCVLNTADYGVPQMRQRTIFIGNRLGKPNPYPKRLRTPDTYEPIESALGGLPAEPDPSINHVWTRHSTEMVERISKVKAGESLYPTYRDAWKRQHKGRPSMTIKENHGGTHIHPFLDRVISAREMARIQTFPDDFIFCGRPKQVMWQVGNAVPPKLAEVVGLALAEYI